MRVEHRLSKLEQAIETTYAPRVCIVFGDNADAEAAVAKFRLANSWPDDAAHGTGGTSMLGQSPGVWQRNFKEARVS